MAGYNNQWPGHGYSNSAGFYEQLQQYAGSQPNPNAYSNPHTNSQHYHQYSNLQPQSSIQVVVPSRQPQVHYQQPMIEDQYSYQQPVQNGVLYEQQNMYQRPPQLDGATNGIPRPNGRPSQNGSLNYQVTRPVAAEAQSPTPSTVQSRRDYAQILLVLAEEYVTAASQVAEQSEEQLKLLSFALGC